MEIQQGNQIIYAVSFLLFFIFPFPYKSLCENLKKLPDCFGSKIIRREAAHEYHRFKVDHGFFHWASSNANLVVHSSTEAWLNVKCWLKAQVTTCRCYIYTNCCCTRTVRNTDSTIYTTCYIYANNYCIMHTAHYNFKTVFLKTWLQLFFTECNYHHLCVCEYEWV